MILPDPNNLVLTSKNKKEWISLSPDGVITMCSFNKKMTGKIENIGEAHYQEPWLFFPGFVNLFDKHGNPLISISVSRSQKEVLSYFLGELMLKDIYVEKV